MTSILKLERQRMALGRKWGRLYYLGWTESRQRRRGVRQAPPGVGVTGSSGSGVTGSSVPGI